VAVGKPPFEVVPYGGHKAKNGMKENTWDESDDDESRSSEEDDVPKVSATGFLRPSVIFQRPPSQKKCTVLEIEPRSLHHDR
jgi:hypothetical protein